jgi:hypothetical protein
MKYGLILFAGALAAACLPLKKKPEQTSNSEASVMNADPLALTKLEDIGNPELLGSWSACETSASDTLKISGITHYHIRDAEHMTVTFRYYSDNDCTVAFTEADAVKAVKNWEVFYKEKAGDDVKDYYASLVEGFTQETTFKASPAKAGEVGTFDQTTNFETAFLSYKLDAGKLYLTDACLPSEIVAASETNCIVKGESAENRSTDFSQVVPFSRQK